MGGIAFIAEPHPWIPAPYRSTGQAFRRYDDVGWLGAIFVAITHAGCDRHTKG